MEKIMVQKHREQRSKGSSSQDPKGKEGRKGMGGDCDGLVDGKLLDPHGIKRSVSHSWEGDTHKASKHTHLEAVGAGNSWAAPVAPTPKENANCCTSMMQILIGHIFIFQNLNFKAM